MIVYRSHEDAKAGPRPQLRWSTVRKQSRSHSCASQLRDASLVSASPAPEMLLPMAFHFFPIVSQLRLPSVSERSFFASMRMPKPGRGHSCASQRYESKDDDEADYLK